MFLRRRMWAPDRVSMELQVLLLAETWEVAHGRDPLAVPVKWREFLSQNNCGCLGLGDALEDRQGLKGEDLEERWLALLKEFAGYFVSTEDARVDKS